MHVRVCEALTFMHPICYLAATALTLVALLQLGRRYAAVLRLWRAWLLPPSSEQTLPLLSKARQQQKQGKQERQHSEECCSEQQQQQQQLEPRLLPLGRLGWRAIRTSELGPRGAAGSGGDEPGWLPATVPGTALGVLVAAGQLPDPYLVRDGASRDGASFFSWASLLAKRPQPLPVASRGTAAGRPRAARSGPVTLTPQPNQGLNNDRVPDLFHADPGYYTFTWGAAFDTPQARPPAALAAASPSCALLPFLRLRVRLVKALPAAPPPPPPLGLGPLCRLARLAVLGQRQLPGPGAPQPP